MPKKIPKTYAFLDTNVLLEYNEYTQIDWLELLESREVCLVIAPIVFDELDDHGRSERERLRETARKLRPKLFRLTKGQTNEVPVPERPSTTVLALPDPGNLSIEPRLKADRNDDHLIASILHFQQARPSERIVLLAGDYGCLQRASSFGIDALEMPVEERRPDPPSPERKQIAQLQGQVAGLQAQLAQTHPQLSINIKGVGDGHMVIRSSTARSILGTIAQEKIERVQALVDQIKKTADESEKRRGLSKEDDIPLDATPNMPILRKVFDQPTWGPKWSMSEDWYRKIQRRLRAFGIDLPLKYLQPVDVYDTNFLMSAFEGSRPGGPDIEWYRLIENLCGYLNEATRDFHNQRMKAVHFPISVQLTHEGGPAARNLDVFLRGVAGSPMLFSYFIDEKKKPKEESYGPLGIRVPAPTMIYPRAEYQQLRKVNRDIEIIKPGTTSEALAFYVVVPPKAGRFEAEVEVVGENLATPIIERFYIEFDEGQSEWP